MQIYMQWFQMKHLATLFFVASQFVTVWTNQSVHRDMSNNTKLFEYLATTYDRQTLPLSTDGNPVNIKMALVVESFDSIEEAAMEFSLYAYLIQQWVDPRLRNIVNATTVLSGEYIDYVWTPDTFCLNARQSDLRVPDEQSYSMLRLNTDGSLSYSRGSYLKLACFMDLKHFPMDNQECYIHFSSYAFTTKYALYKWDNKVSVDIPDRSKELAQFVLVDSWVSARNASYYSGDFTILTATFHFRRRLGYYLLQIYIPCAFLVMLSWIVFWMDEHDTGNRLAVGVTTILTIVFLLGYSNSSVPKMSYVKAMDIYLLSAFAFVFLSLIETIICSRLDNEQPVEETNNQTCHSSVNDVTLNTNEGRDGQQRSYTESYTTKALSNSEIDEILLRCLERLQAAKPQVPHEESTMVASKKSRISLDNIARIVFPVSFIIFNLIYWPLY